MNSPNHALFESGNMFEDDFNDNTMSFGERLQKCRLSGGYSIADIAVYLNRKEQVVIDYEKNTRLPPFKDLWMLSLLYYCSLDSFCRLLSFEIAKRNCVAACLMKSMQHLSKFYFSSRTYPKPEEYEVIWAQVGYVILPREPIGYLCEKNKA